MLQFVSWIIVSVISTLIVLALICPLDLAMPANTAHTHGALCHVDSAPNFSPVAEPGFGCTDGHMEYANRFMNAMPENLNLLLFVFAFIVLVFTSAFQNGRQTRDKIFYERFRRYIYQYISRIKYLCEYNLRAWFVFVENDAIACMV